MSKLTQLARLVKAKLSAMARDSFTRFIMAEGYVCNLKENVRIKPLKDMVYAKLNAFVCQSARAQLFLKLLCLQPLFDPEA